jgi:hypothetical protein
VTSSSVSPQTSVTLSCRDFQQRERVRLYWDSTGGTSIASFVTDTKGSGATSLKIPNTPGGTHGLIAMGSNSGQVVTMPMVVKTSLSLSPTSGKAGTRVTVTFRGYKAGETIAIYWYVNANKTTAIVKNISASSTGTAKYTFKAPTGTAGEHRVDGRGSLKSRADAKFTLTGVKSASVKEASEPAPRATTTRAESVGEPTTTPRKMPTPASTPPPTAVPEPTEAPTSVPEETLSG